MIPSHHSCIRRQSCGDSAVCWRWPKPFSERLIVLSLLLAPAVLHAQDADSPEGDASPYFNIVLEEDVEIRMRDGVTLRATLLRPDAPGRFPALVYRTPYNKDSTVARAAFPRKAARAGYLVFLVDVRGRYASDGEFVAYRYEKQDGYDTIEGVAAPSGSCSRSSRTSAAVQKTAADRQTFERPAGNGPSSGRRHMPTAR